MNGKEDAEVYANRHIRSFLAVSTADDVPAELKQVCRSNRSPPDGCDTVRYSCAVQTIEDGSILTADNLRQDTNNNNNNPFQLSIHQPIIVTDTPESIGMVLPSKKGFGISEVSAIIGPGTPVRVIDVSLQQELEGWSLGDLVDYFEDEDRLRFLEAQKRQQKGTLNTTNESRPQRRSAIRARRNQEADMVLNQISLEFSKTPLREKVNSPQFVRDLDWIENIWPAEFKHKGQAPTVHFYCLTSAAGAFTDFHIDFGGTSVWYNVLSGEKQFCLIPPTYANLKAYEAWLCERSQSNIFLPNMLPETDEAFRLTLKERETLIIPSGWIHAVYTTEDSLVFGGNFLHGLDIEKQIDVYKIEARTHVLEDYRFPYFFEIHFCVALDWIKRIKAKDSRPLTWREFEAIPTLCATLPHWQLMAEKNSHMKEPGGPSVPYFVEAIVSELQLDDFAQALEVLQNAHKEGYDRYLAASTYEVKTEESLPQNSVSNTTVRLPSSTITNHPKVTSIDQSEASKVLRTGNNTTQSSPPKFRIKLSSKAIKSNSSNNPSTAPSTTNQPREGLNSFPDDILDDEWVPTGGGGGGSAKKRRMNTSPSSSSLSKNKRKLEMTGSPPPKGVTSTAPKNNNNKKGRKPAAAAAPVSSRHRLLKKLM